MTRPDAPEETPRCRCDDSATAPGTCDHCIDTGRSEVEGRSRPAQVFRRPADPRVMNMTLKKWIAGQGTGPITLKVGDEKICGKVYGVPEDDHVVLEVALAVLMSNNAHPPTTPPKSGDSIHIVVPYSAINWATKTPQ